jgi:hypothetical protein
MERASRRVSSEVANSKFLRNAALGSAGFGIGAALGVASVNASPFSRRRQVGLHS